MLTLIITTRNGARTLPDLFDALSRVRVPPGGWKVVLVDNGSTDSTKSVVERFRASLPITYLFEPKPGQNVAKNHALNHVEGDLVVCTDDDTTPEPDWLMSLWRAAEAHPEVSFFGGTIRPRWEREPPAWILKEVDLGACFAATDPDQPDGPCDPTFVWGPNMAIRRAVFDQGYRFDESVGPRGASYAMGSETEFTTRVAKDGHRAWFCKAARVHHFIRAHQIERRWILGRAIRFGRGAYRRQLRDAPYQGPLLFRMPRFLVRRTAAQYLRLLRARLVNRDRVFKEQWELNFLVGHLVEAREHFTRPVGAASASFEQR